MKAFEPFNIIADIFCCNTVKTTHPFDIDRSIIINEYFIEDSYLVVKYANECFGNESYRQLCDSEICLMAYGTQLEFSDDDKAKLLQEKCDKGNQWLKIYKIGDAKNIMVGAYDRSNLVVCL